MSPCHGKTRGWSPRITSINGLVVEYIVAIDVTRVRFLADAYYIPDVYLSQLTTRHQHRHLRIFTHAESEACLHRSNATPVGFEPTLWDRETPFAGPCSVSVSES